MIIATDGAQGAANTSVPRGPEIAKLRAEEARCSAQALGIHPPILLGFPDGALGHYNADPSMLIRLAQRLQAELQRLRPDWPDLHGWVGSFRRRRLPSILCLTPGRHRSIRPGQQQR
jgi:LmbE family N-acetylglucosaminyl deacetylase